MLVNYQDNQTYLDTLYFINICQNILLAKSTICLIRECYGCKTYINSIVLIFRNHGKHVGIYI